jgi:hypothetical protein
MASHLYRRKAGGIWWADYTDPAGIRQRFSTRVTDKKAAATILAQRERDDAAQAAAGLASDATGRTVEDLTWHLAVEAHTNEHERQADLRRDEEDVPREGRSPEPPAARVRRLRGQR